jgi:hypothetical protein
VHLIDGNTPFLSLPQTDSGLGELIGVQKPRTLLNSMSTRAKERQLVNSHSTRPEDRELLYSINTAHAREESASARGSGSGSGSGASRRLNQSRRFRSGKAALRQSRVRFRESGEMAREKEEEEQEQERQGSKDSGRAAEPSGHGQPVQSILVGGSRAFTGSRQLAAHAREPDGVGSRRHMRAKHGADGSSRLMQSGAGSHALVATASGKFRPGGMSNPLRMSSRHLIRDASHRHASTVLSPRHAAAAAGLASPFTAGCLPNTTTDGIQPSSPDFRARSTGGGLGLEDAGSKGGISRNFSRASRASSASSMHAGESRSGSPVRANSFDQAASFRVKSDGFGMVPAADLGTPRSHARAWAQE